MIITEPFTVGTFYLLQGPLDVPNVHLQWNHVYQQMNHSRISQSLQHVWMWNNHIDARWPKVGTAFYSLDCNWRFHTKIRIIYTTNGTLLLWAMMDWRLQWWWDGMMSHQAHKIRILKIWILFGLEMRVLTRMTARMYKWFLTLEMNHLETWPETPYPHGL